MLLNRKITYLFLLTVLIVQSAVEFDTIPSRFHGQVTRGNLRHIKRRIDRRIIYKNEHFNQYYKPINDTYLYVQLQHNEKIISEHKTVVFYLSGFGGHRGEIMNLFPDEKKIIEDAANIDYIVPCFEFTHCTDKENTHVLNTDFGQEQDLSTVLIGLKTFCLQPTNTYEKIAIIGRSRGGCVAINLIGVLSTKEHPLLIKHEISENERVLLLESIKKGGIALVTPLIDLRYALQKIFGKFVGFFAYQSAGLFLPGGYKKRSSLKPQKTILQWQGDQIPVTILYAQNDTIVGEKYNDDFAQKLAEYNHKPATIIHIDGGHNSVEIHKISASVITKLFTENPATTIADVVASVYA